MGNVFKSDESISLPTSYWLGVSSTEPQLDGTGVTEPFASNNGYSRTNITSNLLAPENGIITNSDIALNESSAESGWGKVSHYVVFDKSDGGNLLFFGELNPHRTIEASTTLVIKAGNLKITLRNDTSA